MPLLAASQQSELHLSLAVLVLGVLIGVSGHIMRLSWLILLGIIVIGGDCVLFAFVLRPGSG